MTYTTITVLPWWWIGQVTSDPTRADAITIVKIENSLLYDAILAASQLAHTVESVYCVTKCRLQVDIQQGDWIMKHAEEATILRPPFLADVTAIQAMLSMSHGSVFGASSSSNADVRRLLLLLRDEIENFVSLHACN